MTTDAVRDEGPQGPVGRVPESDADALQPWPVMPPFSPLFWEGPTWFAPGPVPGDDAAAGEQSEAGGAVAAAAGEQSEADGPVTEASDTRSEPRSGEALDPVSSGAAAHDAGLATSLAPVTSRDVAESAMRAVAEIDATIAGLQAMRAQLLAGIGHVAVDDAAAERLDPGVGLRDVASEIALMTRRSDRTVEADINHAMADAAQWPATVRAWGAAKIHRGHVAVITDIGSPLQDPAARAAFEEALLPHAEWMNPGRLRALARRELDRHLERPLAERHREARKQRGVFLRTLDDGISHLDVIGPTVLLTGIYDRLTQMAKATRRAATTAAKTAKSAGDTSAGTEPGTAEGTRAGIGTVNDVDAPVSDGTELTFDQLRADLLCDLLLTGEPTGDALSGITAKIEVIVPSELTLGTLLAATDLAPAATDRRPPDNSTGSSGANGSARAVDAASDADEPPPRAGQAAIARLSNGDPVDPETARLLMERAKEWLRVFTDPVTGQVLAADSYTIPERLKRLLRARDQRCRWPGCNQRAERCDIDHTVPWADGGTTEHDNLAHFCRRHHTLKGAHLSRARRWKVRQTSPGVLEFTSPMGNTYIDEPPKIGPVFTDPWTAAAQPMLTTAGRDLPY